MALHAMLYASCILNPRYKGKHLTPINDNIESVEYIYNVFKF